ncbi:phasin family protein [Salipiger abyssi]|uniref:Phasin protein n=1 Tax=Salipiger abyssi TaxID=1250539 RepID=A0A1P8URP6_9RHOB|nr:phasin family protein [Salipiger abyssi]APZ52037.1 Phasin protein [Salipiger abyssi]MBN9886862.1 phasin family protein [Salipiger abyssi]
MNMIATKDRLETDGTTDRDFHIRWTLEPFAATAMLDAWLDYGDEMQSFYADRIREDVATQHQLLHCKSPVEMLQIQAGFFRKAVADYRMHAGRVSELTQRLFFPQPAADQPKT